MKMIQLVLILLLSLLLDPSHCFTVSNPQRVRIRRFQPGDAATLAQLFHETVRQVNLGNYSLSQVKAWAPDDLYFRDWAEACQNRFTVVAESNGNVAGFAELEANGHIDCFYCHKDHQRQGVGKQLYRVIEKQARTDGQSLLFVEASITAKPFFQKMGFSTIEEQTVECRGENFINYKMEKRLG